MTPDDLSYSVRRYDVDGETLFLDTSGDQDGRLYRALGETANPRVMATQDAILYDGDVCTVHYDDGRFLVQHHWMGRQTGFTARDFSNTVVKLERVSPTR